MRQILGFAVFGSKVNALNMRRVQECESLPRVRRTLKYCQAKAFARLPITRMRNRYQYRFQWIIFSETYLFCRIQTASFAHEWINHMVKYFPRYLITTAKHAVKIEPIKYLGQYMPNCLTLQCAEKAIYMWQNSIFIFYINTFQRKQFTKFQRRCAFLTPLMLNQELLLWTFCIDRGFACE